MKSQHHVVEILIGSRADATPDMIHPNGWLFTHKLPRRGAYLIEGALCYKRMKAKALRLALEDGVREPVVVGVEIVFPAAAS
jgi:hypothetical protein